MELLKSRRTNCKSQQTRISTWLYQHKDTMLCSGQLEGRIQLLQNNFTKYSEIQDSIDTLVETSDEVDSDDRSVFEETYFNILSELQTALHKVKLAANPSNLINVGKTNIKLPDIRIPTFTGNTLEFSTFIDLFNSLITRNAKLTSDAEKFWYLKSFLGGAALKRVESIPVTDGNFQVALTLLDKRYNNKKQIVNNHFHQLLNIPPINKCTAPLLRSLATESQSVIESLKTLKLSDTELLNSLIVFMLQQKLDYHTKKDYEEKSDKNALPNLDSLFEYLHDKCSVLENVTSLDSKPVSKPCKNVSLLANHQSLPPFENNATANQVKHNLRQPELRHECPICHDPHHKIYTCPTFTSMSVTEKRNNISKTNLCYNCLGTNHRTQQCKSSRNCAICSKRHHTLIHNDHPTLNVNTQPFSPNSPSSSSTLPEIDTSRPPPDIKASFSTFSTQESQVLLATVQVLIHPKDGPPIPIKALLDNGSQTSFITNSLADYLELPTQQSNLQISGILNGIKAVDKTVNVTIRSKYDVNSSYNVSCAIVKQITNALPQMRIRNSSFVIPNNIKNNLADATYFEPSTIQMLVGAGTYYSLLKPGFLRLGKNLPVLFNSHVGWVISGTVPNTCLHDNQHHPITSHSFCATTSTPSQDQNLENLIERFWLQEETLADPSPLSVEDQLAETIFDSTTKICDSGRYQVNLPLVTPTAHTTLGDTFLKAKNRFLSLEKKLQSNPQLAHDYKKFIDDYISLGHARYIPLTLTNCNNEYKYFVPHLCVLREHSTSTKLRVVFDFSSKSSSSVSFNDISLRGPRVQPELMDILCRFRIFKFVFTADIQKMYRQIITNPTQNFLQNILWRNSPSEPLKNIELTCVSFGQKSAPYLACRVLKDIALNNSQLPKATASLLQQTYVDDIITGVDCVSDLPVLYDELNSALTKHGFSLHKIGSNSQEFLHNISQANIVDREVNLDLDFDKSCKILGLSWSPTSDLFQISSPGPLDTSALTKRKILSVISQCFDPMGLVNPFIVKGKLIMQKLWMSRVNWDQKITDPEIIHDWNEFAMDLSRLSNLTIQRYLFLNKPIVSIELHGFCDSSSIAYGCNVYVRSTYSDNSIRSALVASKSRIAHISKIVTIPKLEMCAMLLLSQLVERMLSIFDNKFNFDSINLWSDSQVALSWIQGHPSKLSVYVSNRVTSIQEITKTYQWRHIKSSHNPADLLSRGKFPEKQYKFWFRGPTFLFDPTISYDSINTFKPIPTPPEAKKTCLLATPIETPHWIIMFNKYSSYSKIQRILAYLFRFINNARDADSRTTSPIQVTELNEAQNFIIKETQGHFFPLELKFLKNNSAMSNKQILSLKPFLDSNSIMRVGGRLPYANIDYNQKHPILLPSKSNITSLILQREHIRLGHGGPQNVLANCRLTSWPLNGLREIKRIISKCTICQRFKAKTAQQIMADLPRDRINVSRPFQNVGIDFGGPFLIKTSSRRNSPTSKCYLSLFVCMVTKAVHLEVVSDLSTELFLFALKRFISRRGYPSIIYSDNGTNFVGANNHLSSLKLFFSSTPNMDEIHRYLANNQIQWKFIPPKSPSWGGLWETGIRSAKRHLYKVMSSSKFNFEQITTVFSQVESILNSRPLYPLSNDPSDFTPLTPGHFLIGTSLTSYPEKNVSDHNVNRLDFFRKCTQIQQSFWKTWSKDYLNRLQNRPKWMKPQPNLAINDMVLVKDENNPPLQWPLARIIATIPGKDGHVRAVQLKTQYGHYVRPITKLSPLPVTEQ